MPARLLLNCDSGESYGAWSMGDDAHAIPLVDQANLACGFHAADPLTMQRAVTLAVARVVRAQTLSLRQREFVEAALSLGASDRRIMLLEVLPNVMASVIIYTSLLIPSFVVLESSLSFLGLGVPPPTPTWGGMLSDSVSYYRQAWWYVVFPGAALLGTTLAFNLFGDSVRDAFDPRAARLRQE